MPRVKAGKKRLHSFTMVELLVIMAIIGILTAITLQAVSALMAAASRSRAAAEIKGMESSLDGYKTDNGTYPVAANMATTDYPKNDGSTLTSPYTVSAQILYSALSGKTNFLDAPIAGIKSYSPFKVGQLGNSSAPAGTTGSGVTYIQDPWTYAYGYSTGTTNSAPYNGTGFFDLWSTAGLLTSTPKFAITNTAAWKTNWQN